MLIGQRRYLTSLVGAVRAGFASLAPPVLALLVSARPPFKPSATFETEELIRSLTDFTDFTAPAARQGAVSGTGLAGSTLLSSLVTLVDVH